ncbi:MAG: hypothetical protein ACRETC_07130 [Gammaproteobacteria bacterium]
MEIQRSSYTREFPLNCPIDLPTNVSEYTRFGRTLFVATSKAAYINVGPLGADFVRLLRSGVCLGDAAVTTQS